MYSAALAQWLLSRVTTRESAAATVGDLIESGAGPLQLWAAVGSRIVRSVDAKTLGWVIAAFVAQVPAFFLIIRLLPQMRWFAVAPFISATVTAELLIGSAMGRWSRKPVTACLLLAIADAALLRIRENGVAINWLYSAVPLIAGMILTRRSGRRAPSHRLS
jgi:hypothetical protein